VNTLNYILSIVILCSFINSYCQDTLTVREVFDFEIGDAFHYWEHGYDYYDKYFDKILIRITITGKSFTANYDTLIYERAVEGYIHGLDLTLPGSEYPYEYKYNFYSSSDEVRYTDLDSSILYYLKKNHFNYLDENYWENFDTAFEVSDTLIYQSDYLCGTRINGYLFSTFSIYDKVEYGQGLGLTRMLSGAEECICTTMDLELIFYKKGIDSCGVADNRTNTGLNSNHLSETIEIYPNPAQDYIYIQISSESLPVIIQINNSKGQTINHMYLNHSNERIDITSLEPGIYFVSFFSDKQTVNNRFLNMLLKE
jgi:hypothetical protein